MKQFFENLVLTLYKQFIFAFDISARYIARLLEAMLPYVMFLIGYSGTGSKHHIFIYIFIPPLVWVIVALLRSYANYVGKGPNIPIPQRRFTEANEDGEVTVEYDRLQELILYTADLEDYLERSGLLERSDVMNV